MLKVYRGPQAAAMSCFMDKGKMGGETGGFGLLKKLQRKFSRPQKLESRLSRAVQLRERPQSTPKRYLCVAAIFRNEAPYLVEWIEFHRLVGVEHMYLYDHGSSDRPVERLEPYIQQGFVTLIPWSTFHTSFTPQLLQAAHAITTFGPNYRWMALIDVDEFVFPTEDASLFKTMTQFEDLPAVAVPWIMFGFSGHESKPEGLVIENYTMRAPFPPPLERKSIFKWKSILNPAEIVAVHSPHSYEFRSGEIGGGWDENRQFLSENTRYDVCRTANVLRLNHYTTRSKAEFESKMTAPSAMLTSEFILQRRRQKFGHLCNLDNFSDKAILRFAGSLRANLGLDA